MLSPECQYHLLMSCLFKLNLMLSSYFPLHFQLVSCPEVFRQNFFMRLSYHAFHMASPISSFFIPSGSNVSLSLQNPTLGVVVTEGVNVLRRQTVLWSTEGMLLGIVPKAVWHWGGDEIVANDPFGAPGSTPSYVCLPHAWGSVDGNCLILLFCRTNIDHKKAAGKYKAKALAEFKFRCRSKYGYGKKWLCWDSVV
jgi:hypothetical protein